MAGGPNTTLTGRTSRWGWPFPSARFAPATGQTIGLRVPAELGRAESAHLPGGRDVTARPSLPAPPAGDHQRTAGQAVELERVIPPSGNVWLAGQQIWLEPAMTGRTIRLWAGLDRVHVLAQGCRIKTLPSRLDAGGLARLATAGATPTGPPQLSPPQLVRRRVSVRGAIMIGGQRIQVGLPHAGKTADVTIEADTYHITVEDGITLTAPRTTSRDIKRHKAANYAPPQQPRSTLSL